MKLKTHITNNLSILLEDTLESYYWIGFIFADGCICNNRLKICVSSLDMGVLISFCNYISVDPQRITSWKINDKLYCQIAIKDKYIVPKIQNKYQINKRKTYNPPTKDFDLNENLIAMYIGFIDGDGSVKKLHKRNDQNISVKCHGSWFNFLSKMQCNLYTYFQCTKHGANSIALLNKKGYAYITLSNNLLLKKMKQFILNNELPVLHRKWSLIDMNFLSKYEKAAIMKLKISEMIDNDLSIIEISKALNIKYSTVYMSLYRDTSKKQ